MNLLVLLVLASQTCADAQQAYDDANFQGVAPLAQAALENEPICALEVWAAAHIGLGETQKAIEKFERILKVDRRYKMVGKSPKVRALFEKTKAEFLAANPEPLLSSQPKQKAADETKSKTLEPMPREVETESLQTSDEEASSLWPYYTLGATSVVVAALVGSALVHFNNNKCHYVGQCAFGP